MKIIKNLMYVMYELINIYILLRGWMFGGISTTLTAKPNAPWNVLLLRMMNEPGVLSLRKAMTANNTYTKN